MDGAPPPPPPEEKKQIKPMPGRLKVTLLECREIGQINQFGQKKEGAKVDPYVKLKLGTFKKAPTLKSKVQKKQRAAFSLHEETLQFDIFDPVQYLSRSGEDGNDEIALHVGLWDSNRFSDDMLGEVTISVLDFMEMDDKRYGVLNVNESTDWWPMQFVTKNGVVCGRDRPHHLSSIHAGCPCHYLLRGRNLKNISSSARWTRTASTLGKEEANQGRRRAAQTHTLTRRRCGSGSASAIGARRWSSAF